MSSPTSNDSILIYTFASPRPQNFLLSYPIIKYIFTKPSSGKAWKKLIKTCKYFFSKNSIYPVKYLHHEYGSKKWDADGAMFDAMENIAKLWVYDEIHVRFRITSTTILSSLIPKIVKCNLLSMNIYYQNLTFDEYQFLTLSGNLKQLWLTFCTICHPDGTLGTFDQIFKNVPKLECFTINCAENSSSMFQGDTDILLCLKELFYFDLYGLTEEFDFESITDFLLKNEKNLFITLTYNPFIALSDAYKEILESFIAKIIKTPPKRIPDIYFPGFQNSIYYNDYQKLFKLRK